MATDLFGNAVTGGTPEALAAVDDFIGGFLGYEPRLLTVLGAAEAEPGACLVNAYAAVVWMFLESPDGPAKAEPFLVAAERAAPAATPRERQFVAHVRAWQQGDIDLAQRIGDELLAANPRDLAMLKLHQYHSFNRGECAAMLRVARQSLPHAADVPHLHGMLAFALEQCHQLDAADAAAREALSMTRQEPWAQHALAHVMLTQGRIREGRDFLLGMQDTWTDLTSFMHTHNHWHLALFDLSLGDTAAALRRYDEHVWARDPGYSQDQVGAVSLLARIELAGGDVGQRWQALAPWLQARAADTTQPFLTVQYHYGLERAGDAAADTLREAVAQRAALEADLSPHRRVWTAVALPLVEGNGYYLRGDAASAVAHWGPVQGQLLAMGGSHAQRDLFAQLYLDALVQLGEWNTVQQLAELRRVHEPEGVPLNRLLAQAYDALGLAKDAAVARARAVHGAG